MNAVGTEGLGEADFARFRELVLRSSGMELSEVRRSELERAISRMVERAAMSGPSSDRPVASARRVASATSSPARLTPSGPSHQ